MELKDVNKKLPKASGVYFFRKSRRKTPLYIGKATSLKDRVRSYFGNDLAHTRGAHMVHMINEADSITFEATDSVLEALLLEASLIKKYKPPYNTKEKSDKSFNYVVVTKEEFSRIEVVRGKELYDEGTENYKKIYGPFPKGNELKDALKIIRKIFPWRDSKCEQGSGKPCFNRQIGLCPGVCTGEISKKEYLQVIKHITYLFAGKKKTILLDLEIRMKRAVAHEEFEEAAIFRNQIFSLNHIQDVALIKKYTNTMGGVRLEAYDVAHMSGQSSVGVMVVMEAGVFAKNSYRKFKLRETRGNDDVNNLKEILMRRFKHSEWQLPQLVVVDGGRAQVNIAQSVLASFNLKIPVIGVVKDSSHNASRFIGGGKYMKDAKDQIIMVNAEAHRFAINYHKNLRAKAFRVSK